MTAENDRPLGRTRRLLIAGASVRSAWQSAVRSSDEWNWPIIEAADRFGDAEVLESSRFWPLTPGYQNLVEVMAASRPDAWLYTGALENYPDLIAAAARHAPLWGCSADCLREVRDPNELAVRLGPDGCSVAESRDRANGLPLDGSWLRKRRASGAGLGVTLLTDENAADANESEDYYQRRVEGRACGAVFLAADRCAWLWGVTQMWQGTRFGAPGPFQYVGSWGPRHLDSLEALRWRQIGDSLARHFDLRGLFGVDAMVTSQQVVVLEVNPRWTASVEVLERATGRNAMRLHADAVLRAKLPKQASEAESAESRSVGKAVVYATEPVVASREFLEWAAEQNRSAIDRHARGPLVADLPAEGTFFETGDPVVTVFAETQPSGVGEPLAVEPSMMSMIEQTRRVLRATAPGEPRQISEPGQPSEPPTSP